MKRIIKLTENDLIRIVNKVIKENENEWISQSEDMEDSDFSKMSIKKKIANKTKRAFDNLSKIDKNMLIDYLKNTDTEEVKSIIKKELKNEPIDIKESKDTNYKVRKIIANLLKAAGIIAAVGMIPSEILVSGVMSGLLGITGIGLGVLAKFIEPKK